MKNLPFIIVFSILLLSNCKDNTQNTSPQLNSNLIVFSYGYMNGAWGYKHQGGFIAQSGDIYTFNYTSNTSDTVATTEQDGIITSSEMQRLLEITALDSLKISSDTMTVMLLHFDKVIAGNNSARNGCGADMGGWYLNGYHKSNDSTYTIISLYETGDNRQRNLSPDTYPLICYLGKIAGMTIDTASCN